MQHSDEENSLAVNGAVIVPSLESLEIRSSYCGQNQANGDDHEDFKIDNYFFPRTFIKGEEDTCQVTLLQESLFSNVCPTIYFGLKDEKIYIPNDVRRYLLWRLSLITPSLIKETVTRSGFRLIKEKNSERKRWIATWCKHMKSFQFEDLKETQKVNHFPGCFQLGRKDRLSWNLKQFTPLYSEDHFHPNTYILPHDISLLRKRWISEETRLLILKPPASARGNGVTVINQWGQIPKTAKIKKKHCNKPVMVAQEYISNPCLLFNATKFDLRVYVLVTSFNPLRVYIYDDGLVRFASEPYSLDENTLGNLFVHVTNYCINKLNNSYEQNNCVNSRSGHKWSLNTLWKYLKESYPNLKVDNLWKQIIDIVIKTLISVQESVTFLTKRHLKSPYNGFELLGFDIMLDSDFKPWLLEVNISPSLKSESSLDDAIKSHLIKDVFNTVGYRPPYCLPHLFGKCYHRTFVTETLVEENEKHVMFRSIRNFDMQILDDLTYRDIYHLMEAEDELSRCGRFARILPSAQSEKYFQFFGKNTYLDHLLNAWEKRYSYRRAEGINYLRKLSNEKLFLKKRQ